jgi:DNA-binding CsgD family transcriptional regulator
MTFSSSYNSKRKIYDEHLKFLKGIKFSAREIDISACLVHNRGEKKISDLLDIMPKTVNTHTYNIMQKLQCNSRDTIIDFFEKSEKLHFLREYYLHLVIYSHFKKQLLKIGSILKPLIIHCYINFSKITDEQSQLMEQLDQHLKSANITLLKQINNNFTINEPYIIVENASDKKLLSTNKILLLLNKTVRIPALKGFVEVDFSSVEKYYFTVFKLLEQIVQADGLRPIIQHFESDYTSLCKSWVGDTISSPVKNSSSKNFLKNNKIILVSGLLIIILASIFQLIFHKTKPNILEINKAFTEYAEKISADNITDENKKKNYAIFSTVEKTMGRNEIQQYFMSSEVTEKQLLNYLYVCHALANQYLFMKHDGLKARKLLLKTKHVAQKFINTKNNLEIDFDELNSEELYNELSIIKDLPELYTRIMYSLGRSYLYQGDLKDSINYFNVARYLGNKLNLFEGYLSIRSGLEAVHSTEIVGYLNSNAYDKARTRLLTSINIFKNLLEDDKEYIVDYQPFKLDQKTIVPKNDLFNRVICSEFISKHYARLIFLTDQSDLQRKYLDEIHNIYIGSNKFKGLIDTYELTSSKSASLALNNLGYILLKLYESNIDFNKFRKALNQKLKLEEQNVYTLIECIFNLAKSKARNNDCVKADSYDGLIQLYTLKLKDNTLSMQIHDEIRKDIEEYRFKRDAINKNLNREGWRQNKNQI